MNETYTQNFDELIVGFTGESLRDKICRKNFDESLAIRQCFSLSNFCAIQ